jgi:hypothetical protein
MTSRRIVQQSAAHAYNSLNSPHPPPAHPPPRSKASQVVECDSSIASGLLDKRLEYKIKATFVISVSEGSFLAL